MGTPSEAVSVLSAQPGLDPPPDDFLDLLQEARAVGLELVGDELPRWTLVRPLLGFGGVFLPVRHPRVFPPLEQPSPATTPAPWARTAARPSCACGESSPGATRVVPRSGDARTVLPQRAEGFRR